jgi:predicted nucleic acid-binding protein
MILVETSAWIEYDRATGSAVDTRVAQLIESGGDIAVSEPILMEMLAGARNDEAVSLLRRLLTSFGWIPAEAATDIEGAARVYRSCREVGITPRGLVDCMVASIALRTDATLLTADQDLSQIASVLPLRLDEASPRAPMG